MKKRPAMLNGLHPSQDIIGGMPPWEILGGPQPEPSPSTRYITRGSQNGFKEALYNSKVHPMDRVTRPKLAARRERKAKTLETVINASEEDSGDEIPVLISDTEDSIESDDDHQAKRPSEFRYDSCDVLL